MERMTTQSNDVLDEMSRGFPELDEAARQRAAARVAAGIEAHAALAHESVMLQLMRAYN